MGLISKREGKMLHRFKRAGIDFDCGNLRVRVQHNNKIYLTLCEWYGYDFVEKSHHFLPGDSSSFAVEAFWSRKIAVIDDVQENNNARVYHVGWIRNHNLRSAITVPLFSASQGSLGVVSLYRKCLLPFTDEEVDLIKSISEDIAQGIAEKGVTYQSDRWSIPFSQALSVADRFIALSQKASKFIYTTSFSKTADMVVKDVCELVCPHFFKEAVSWITFYDDGSKYLAIPSSYGHLRVSGEFVKGFHKDNIGQDYFLFKRENGINYYDIHHQNTELCEHLTDVLRRENIHSLMSYPLLATGDRPIGVLWVGRHSPFRFSEFDELVFHNFADLVAIDLRNNRLYERHQFIARLKFPTDEFQTLQLLMENVARQAHEEFDALFATIILGDAQTNLPDMMSSTHKHIPNKYIAQNSLDDQTTQKLWDQLMSSDSGIVTIRYLPDHPELYGEFAKENAIESLIAIRVHAYTEPIGALILNFRLSRQFEQKDREELRELVAAAGIAIRNYQLTETLQFLAQENTRRNVRRQFREDLHDTRNIFQTRVMLPLDHLHDRMVEAGLDDFSDELLRIIGQARASDMRYKSIQESMRDPTLVNEGLIVALGKLETEYDYIQPNLKIEVNVLGDDVPPAYLDYSLYRIATEAINNAARHGGTNVLLKMTLTTSQTDTLLIIEDNGRGFKYNGRETEGLGLTTMRHRASEIGATLDIQSQVGYGTTITVNAPHRHTTEDKFLDE